MWYALYNLVYTFGRLTLGLCENATSNGGLITYSGNRSPREGTCPTITFFNLIPIGIPLASTLVCVAISLRLNT